MELYDRFREISVCPIADALDRKQVVDFHIKSIWATPSRIAGPAFTVRCAHGDNLMLHAAIYSAPEGSIVAVQCDSADFAVAGGNVCAVAQRRGIQGFIVDGVIRDLEEIRDSKFPVYARGLVPKPGGKDKTYPINETIQLGGVEVHPDDIIVADEEGIVVVPKGNAEEVLQKAIERSNKDETTSLDDWESAHKEKIFSILEAKGVEV